jgi:hypothetical protein
MNMTRRVLAALACSLAATSLAAPPAQQDAAASPDGLAAPRLLDVVGCSIRKTPDGERTTLLLTQGRAVSFNTTMRSTTVVGAQHRLATGTRGPRWAKCRVGYPGHGRPRVSLIVTTVGGARWQILNPQHPQIAPAPAPEPVAPPRPTAAATWPSGPLTLSAPGLDPSWDLPAVAAAFDTALPGDRQISVTTAPCATATCISVTEVPSIALTGDATDYWGMAWPDFRDGVMRACSIHLSSVVPPGARQQITAHEVGHCLGLPHWQAGSLTVMSTSGVAAPGGPTPTDLAWVAESYR